MATLETRTTRKGKKRRVRYVDPATGRRRSKTFEYKADAESLIRNLERAKAGGKSFDPDAGSETLSSYAPKWFRTHAELKPKTRADYRSLWEQKVLPALGDRPLREIEPSDIEAFVGALREGGLSASRTRKAFLVVSMILAMALRDRRITMNPCQSVRTPTPRPKELCVPTRDEVEAIVAALSSHRDRTLVRLFAYLGPRWGEAIGLRRRHIDVMRRRLKIVKTVSEVNGALYEDQETKNYERRVLTLPVFLANDLARLLESVPSDPNAYVFAAGNGRPLRTSNFRAQVWIPTLQAVGLGQSVEKTIKGERKQVFEPAITPHDLRHFAATTMISDGIPIPTVARILGHADSSVTLRIYAHWVQDDMDRAADVMDAAYGISEVSPQSPQGDAQIVPFPSEDIG